jgi:DNA topoisomerase II
MADLSKKYQKKTDKQHILDNPDTYIGSIENVEQSMFVLDDGNIINKDIHYIPGLYKLFDEGIVNCRDHVIRMKKNIDNNIPNSLPVTNISITISEDGTITMLNDGNGIDVEKHPEYNVWIPELIFGHLRTSTNYNKEEEKIVGGKNGFGFKLVLIWSNYGEIETVDHVRKLKYKQNFSNNLDIIGKPSITKSSVKPYTKITFRPDYNRFYGNDKLPDDMVKLLRKRVYDIAAVTDKTVKVKLDGNNIPVKTFLQYIEKYGIDTKVHEQSNERWEYVVALSPTDEFMHVSFVNGIYTSKGGKHVDYILNQITKKMVTYIEKKKKITVTSTAIKEQLMLFIRCDVVNPAFDSQTKDYMNTPITKFGSSCVVSDKFIEKVAKLGVMESACAITQVKDNKAAKKSDGKKSRNVRGIPKLIDANWAGTPQSNKCTIIFCEGDSAKAGIVSGLTTDDRNTIGVYPMRGKMLNVRGEQSKKILENKEVIEIKRILGLEANKEYSHEDVKKNLRYGKILFMTDQDLDGSHIKGLGINLFQSMWNSLSKVPGFIGFMNTPILKAKKGSNELLFYNDGEYEEWKSKNSTSGWKIKYYKGLGTSTGVEFKEYFENKKIVTFEHEGDVSDNSIDKVFNKKRADDRKTWLGGYNRKTYLDTNQPNVTFCEFIDQEMIHFSKYDCDRSIPNMMDGLKISLRKILYSAFKKNLTTEIKVAQFSGYVSEHSGYHHGEASLNGAIVGMAQNFVGSNNVNLFRPNGQFGTRLQGGKDSASERYIFTQLQKITRKIYPQYDDNIVDYLEDDGFPVEPIYYMPIVPMVLINGSKGIGTGFSTEILPYNLPLIVDYIRRRLTAKSVCDIKFIPYYEGFQGTIENINDTKYLVKGVYKLIDDNNIHITELPVGTWTDDYKQVLEGLLEGGGSDKGKKTTPVIKDYRDMSKTTNVDIIVQFSDSSKLYKLMSTYGENGINGLEKLLRLTTTISTTNMHLFDSNEKLKKYSKVEEIIDDYYDVRLEGYVKRKKHIIKILEGELIVLHNKAMYIKELLEDTLDIRRKKRDVIVKMLETKKYDKIEGDEDYKYLLKMTMDSVSEENISKINSDHVSKKMELDNIKNTRPEDMWLNELDELLVEYGKHITERKQQSDMSDKKSKKVVKKGK